MVLNKPMVDYLRLTTYSRKIADYWTNIAREERLGIDDLQSARMLQYRGSRLGAIFVGEASQRGRSHYMLDIPGNTGDWFIEFAYLGDESHKCTRIDLQVSILKPDNYDSRATFDALNSWDASGRPRQVSIVQSGDGYDTIYIGSRQSDRFTRIYVKPTDLGDVIRFEVEYKSNHAEEMAYRVGKFGHSAIDSALHAEIASLPDLPNGLKASFARCCKADPDRPRPVRATTELGGLVWIREQINPAIMRLMNDHEIGHSVRTIVKGWATEAIEIEKGLDLK